MKKLKVVNISNLNLYDTLTINKIYDCIYESKIHYLIKDDINRKSPYYKWRFKDVTRELKLNKLL